MHSPSFRAISRESDNGCYVNYRLRIQRTRTSNAGGSRPRFRCSFNRTLAFPGHPERAPILQVSSSAFPLPRVSCSGDHASGRRGRRSRCGAAAAWRSNRYAALEGSRRPRATRPSPASMCARVADCLVSLLPEVLQNRLEHLDDFVAADARLGEVRLESARLPGSRPGAPLSGFLLGEGRSPVPAPRPPIALRRRRGLAQNPARCLGRLPSSSGGPGPRRSREQACLGSRLPATAASGGLSESPRAPR
jgi:hypothetical protein